MSLKVGDKVTWAWGDGTATGTIKQIYTEKVTREIKGAEVTRNGSADDPAYLIEQADGDRVLKAGTEISAA